MEGKHGCSIRHQVHLLRDRPAEQEALMVASIQPAPENGVICVISRSPPSGPWPSRLSASLPSGWSAARPGATLEINVRDGRAPHSLGQPPLRLSTE